MKSAKEVIDFAKKNNAVMVDLKFIDFLGTWQHFAVSISDLSEEMLKKSFQNYFLLMLGMSDISTKPNTDYVASIFDKVTDQGSHRLERGRNFFNGVLSKSRELDTFLKWGMVEVPTKDGHSNTKQMVPFAAELFFERLK